MNVDLHTHTFPASDCSRITYRDYIGWCVDNAVEAVALTNHGDLSDNRKLGPALAAEGVLLIDGVEISTLFGDFVIFSPDLDYLDTLRAVQDAPRPGDRAATTPPWCGCIPAPAAAAAAPPTTRASSNMVGDIVDAVEVYNGSLARRPVRAHGRADRRVARRGPHRRQRRPQAGRPHGLLHGAARPRHRPPPTWWRRSAAGAPCPHRTTAPAHAAPLRALLGGRHVDPGRQHPRARRASSTSRGTSPRSSATPATAPWWSTCSTPRPA